MGILYTLSKRNLPQLGKNVCVPSKCNKAGGQTDKNHKNTLFLSKRTCKTNRPPLSESLPKKVFSLENEWKNCRNDPREKREKRCPALAVGTQLKPARDGRWVASVMLHAPFFQPEGREVCDPHHETSVPFEKCGFKSVHFHAPSRANLVPCCCGLIKMLCRGLGYSSSSSEKSSFMNSL